MEQAVADSRQWRVVPWARAERHLLACHEMLHRISDLDIYFGTTLGTKTGQDTWNLERHLHVF
jgi:hypothetical protein